MIYYYTSMIILSYLLGAVPIGWLIAQSRGIDIRSVGSGNIGATNVFRMVGKGWGIATFAGDVLKGFIPAYVFPYGAACCGPAVNTSIPLGLLCGCAAIIGHNWPVYLKFKGGKGVATTVGVLIGVAPLAAGLGLMGWVLIFVLTGYVSVASMGAAIVIPAISWWLYLEEGVMLPAVLTALGLIIIGRHHGNIVRLRKGTEHRFIFNKKS